MSAIPPEEDLHMPPVIPPHTENLSLSSPLLWFPLLAAIMFAIAAILIKRATKYNIDVWRTTFIANLTTTAMSMSLLTMGGKWPYIYDLWQPMFVGFLFFAGQTTAMLALNKGEISIAAPILGLKILMVAFFATMFIDHPLPESIWIACVLSTLGVVMLNLNGSGGTSGNFFYSVVCSIICAAAFGLCDVCVQLWSAPMGMGVFVPLALFFNALFSFSMVPFFKGSLREIPKPAWKTLLLGCSVMGFQSLIIAVTISLWSRAPTINVLYSTRGVFSVLLMAFVARHIGVTDQTQSARIAIIRAAGAVCICTAIFQLM
jgi:drug/metabolite transporter (DMT)-like permease